MCISARKLMKLVLKLYFCSLQIALVQRNIFEIKILLQNMYNAIINWNLANFYCWENRKGNNFEKCYSSFLVAAIILLFLLLLPLLHSLPCTEAGIPSVSQALIHSHACPLLPAVPRSSATQFSQWQSNPKLLKMFQYIQVPCNGLCS